MAAHPFGPIETFLLRGFNKKQLELDRVDPKFMFSRKVEIPTTNTHPLFAFYKEVTHGVQRTAIVNSSDYEVKFGAQWPNTDLLSRGLGYRITFTMPADKEFNIQDADTYPSVEITVTDALGG